MNHHIFYGGLTFTCIAGMAANTYRRNGYDNLKDFVCGMFDVSNITFISVLGALQVKCFDAVLNKYIKN